MKVQENTQEKWQPCFTKGEGDCAFHALFGAWDEAKGLFFCEDVVLKRQTTADQIRHCQDDNRLLSLVKTAIKALVLSHRSAGIGQHLTRLREQYHEYAYQALRHKTETWQRLEDRSSQYPDIIKHINGFIDNYKKKDLTQESFFLKFSTCLNEDDGTLECLMLSVDELDSAYQSYVQLMDIHWDDLINEDVIDDYASFIERPGTWLLRVELQIVAFIFNIGVALYWQGREAPWIYNEQAKEQVAIHFDFTARHYERMAMRPVILPQQESKKRDKKRSSTIGVEISPPLEKVGNSSLKSDEQVTSHANEGVTSSMTESEGENDAGSELIENPFADRDVSLAMLSDQLKTLIDSGYQAQAIATFEFVIACCDIEWQRQQNLDDTLLKQLGGHLEWYVGQIKYQQSWEFGVTSTFTVFSKLVGELKQFSLIKVCDQIYGAEQNKKKYLKRTSVTLMPLKHISLDNLYLSIARYFNLKEIEETIPEELTKAVYAVECCRLNYSVHLLNEASATPYDQKWLSKKLRKANTSLEAFSHCIHKLLVQCLLPLQRVGHPDYLRFIRVFYHTVLEQVVNEGERPRPSDVTTYPLATVIAGYYQLNKSLLMTPEERIASMSLDSTPLMDYRARLSTYRATLQEALNTMTSLNDIFKLQQTFTRQCQSFVKSLCQICEAWLGPAPCQFAWLASGSMSRGDMTLYSDVELILLIEQEDDKVKGYFRAYVKLLQTLLICCGETYDSKFFKQHIAYEASWRERKGFYFDAPFLLNPSNDKNIFLTTPEALITTFKNKVASRRDETSILSSLLSTQWIYGNDRKTLYNQYQTLLTKELETRTPETAPLLSNQIACQLMASDLKKYYNDLKQLELADDTLATEVRVKALFAQPLVNVLTSLATYYGLEARIPKVILEQLRDTQGFDNGFIYQLEQGLALAQYWRLCCQQDQGNQLETTTLDMLNKYQKQLIHLNYPVLELIRNDPLALISTVIIPLHTLVHNLANQANPDDLYASDYYYHAEWFQQSLKHLVYPPETQLTQQKNLPQLSWIEYNQKQDKVHQHSAPLRPEVAERLINEKGELDDCKEKKYTYANHPVKHIRLGLTDIHAKLFPELPGLDLAVNQLAELLFHYGVPPTTIAKLTWYDAAGNQYEEPLLLIQTILMSIVGCEAEEKHYTNLVETAFTQQFFLTVLTQPEDAKPDNVLLQPVLTSQQGYYAYRLWAIDNDHAFQEPLVKKGLGPFAKTELQTKSLMYCLAHMQQPLCTIACDKIRQVNPYDILHAWLNRLDSIDISIRKLFDKEAIITYFKRSVVKKTTLPILLESETIQYLYIMLCRLQRYLSIATSNQDSSSRIPHLTPMNLLYQLQPLVALRYYPTLELPISPIERFDHLTYHLYSSVVQGHHKTALNNPQIQRSGLRKMPNKKEVLERKKYTPKICLDFLIEQVYLQEDKLSSTRQALLNGQEQDFLALNYWYWQELVINDISYKNCSDEAIEEEQQQKILKMIIKQKVSFRRLKLVGWYNMSDQQMKKLLNQSPYLTELDLRDCHQLTNTSLNIIISVAGDRLIKLVATHGQLTQCVSYQRWLTTYNFTTLRTLVLDDCTLLNEIRLPMANHLRHLSLKRCSALQVVIVAGNWITLDVRGCQQLTLEMLRTWLMSSPGIIKLRLTGCIQVVEQWRNQLLQYARPDGPLSQLSEKQQTQLALLLLEASPRICLLPILRSINMSENVVNKDYSDIEASNEMRCYQQVKQALFFYCNKSAHEQVTRLAKETKDRVLDNDVEELLKWVSDGHLEHVETMLQENVILALAQGNVKDRSDREFEQITAFQYAAWAFDIDMCKLILKYLGSSEGLLQLRALEQDHHLLSSHGPHYDFQALIDKYADCPGDDSPLTFDEKNEYWQEGIGGLQRLCPSWVVYMLCQIGKNAAWLDQGMPRTVVRQYEYDEYYDGQKQLDWYFEGQYNGGRIGEKCAVVRGSTSDRAQKLAPHCRGLSQFGKMGTDAYTFDNLKNSTRQRLMNLIADLNRGAYNAPPRGLNNPIWQNN